jgi:hypothetical protein
VRYIIVTVASLADATVEEPEKTDMALLDIASYDGLPLLFDNLFDAEDYMDRGDHDVEMVVIEAPVDLSGIIIA